MNVPEHYDRKGYKEWHEKEFPQDKDLSTQVEKLREKLFQTARVDLVYLDRFCDSVFKKLSKEYKRKNNGIDPEFKTPLKEALRTRNQALYNNLFKEEKSIVEKIWRKNKENPPFTFSNVQSSMKDLVRTEIICKSLDACKFLSANFNITTAKLVRGGIRNEVDKFISNIESAPELKMASGYFAYHSLVYFKSGLTVEVQIHSSLSAQWRKLSHLLYEIIRTGDIETDDYGSVKSRIISLGHMLHIADYTLANLEKDFLKERSKT